MHRLYANCIMFISHQLHKFYPSNLCSWWLKFVAKKGGSWRRPTAGYSFSKGKKMRERKPSSTLQIKGGKNTIMEKEKASASGMP